MSDQYAITPEQAAAKPEVVYDLRFYNKPTIEEMVDECKIVEVRIIQHVSDRVFVGFDPEEHRRFSASYDTHYPTVEAARAALMEELAEATEDAEQQIAEMKELLRGYKAIAKKFKKGASR